MMGKIPSHIAQWVAERSFASKQNFSFFEHQQQTTKTSQTKRGEWSWLNKVLSTAAYVGGAGSRKVWMWQA